MLIEPIWFWLVASQYYKKIAFGCTRTHLRVCAASPHVQHQFHLLINGAFLAGKLLRMFAVVVLALVEDLALVVGRVLRGQELQKRLTISNPPSFVIARLKG